MDEMVNLTIDGREVTAPRGATVIDAAEAHGIHIPNLCHLKGMKGIGACRLCLVEVKGMKNPLTACTMKVRDGMVITTKSDRIQEIRKFVIDLIISMHPLDCMTCTKAGVCRLQQYAYDLEIRESSFKRKKFGYPADSANPFIRRDPEYCVLCGRCIRACRDQGTSVLDFMGRGVGSKVTTAGDKPLQDSGCTFCGSCVDVCPVNALLEADRWRKGREWEYESHHTVCTLCGCGCDITASTRGGEIMKINARRQSDSSHSTICVYGRFGFDCLTAETRLRKPLCRVNGQLQETGWEEAIQLVSREIRKAGGAGKFIASAAILNEDALTLGRFADKAGISRVETTADLYATPGSMLAGSGDPETADLIVLAGFEPDQRSAVLPALDSQIRKRINAGAKLITIAGKPPRIASVAAIALSGEEAAIIRSLVHALIGRGLPADDGLKAAVAGAEASEDIDKAATLYMEAARPLVLVSPAFYGTAANLARLKGGVLSVPLEANARGVFAMGIGGLEAALAPSKLLYVIGEIPEGEGHDTEFLVVQHSHLTDLARRADVVLPSAGYLETDGTIFDFSGRMREVHAVVAPPDGVKTHRMIFGEIAASMGISLEEPNRQEIIGLLRAESGTVQGVPEPERVKMTEPRRLMAAVNASVISGSRLEWLHDSHDKPE